MDCVADSVQECQHQSILLFDAGQHTSCFSHAPLGQQSTHAGSYGKRLLWQQLQSKYEAQERQQRDFNELSLFLGLHQVLTTAACTSLSNSEKSDMRSYSLAMPKSKEVWTSQLMPIFRGRL